MHVHGAHYPMMEVAGLVWNMAPLHTCGTCWVLKQARGDPMGGGSGGWPGCAYLYQAAAGLAVGMHSQLLLLLRSGSLGCGRRSCVSTTAPILR